MDKYLLVTLLLAFGLSGCAGYSPETMTPVKDQAQFKTDLYECGDKAGERQDAAIKNHRGDQLAIGLFGLPAAIAVNSGEKNDFNSCPRDWIDECMREKGYDVPERERNSFCL